MKALMYKQTALSAFVAVALAGCSLAPDYKRPDAPVSGNWPDQPKVQYGAYAKPTALGTQPAASVEPQAGTPAADIGWREFFRDPRLQRLIELSLANNRDLRVAVQRVEEARAQYGVQRGAQWPSIGAGIQGQRQHLPANMRAPGAGSISSSYQAGIGLTTFEIDLFGRLRSLSEAAYQQYLSTEQAQKSVHITLVGSVAQAYFNLRAAEVQMDLTQRTLASRQESYNLVKRRFDGGVSSELDLNQAKTLLDSASSSLAELARARAQAVNALVVLVGAPLPEDLPAPAAFGREQLLATVPAGCRPTCWSAGPTSSPPSTSSSRPMPISARARVLPDHLPDRPAGAASPSLSDLFKGGQGYWSFSSITTPLFAGGSIREGLNLAKARDNIAVAQYEKTIQQAFREVSDALAGEATYSAQLDAQRGLQDSSARTLELSNLRYTNGVDSYLQADGASGLFQCPDFPGADGVGRIDQPRGTVQGPGRRLAGND